jgi:flagellar FliL protein
VATKETAQKDDEKDDEKPEGEEAAEGEGAKKGPNKKFIIMIAAAAGLFLILLVVVAVLLLRPHNESAAAKKDDQATSAADASSQAGKPVYFALGDLLVNLSGEGKHPNFLKVKISLELTDEKEVPLMEALKPRIIDNFQVYLRELRIEDLRGSAGMYRLREELLARVTEAAQPLRVKDVLFQEMLVQ